MSRLSPPRTLPICSTSTCSAPSGSTAPFSPICASGGRKRCSVSEVPPSSTHLPSSALGGLQSSLRRDGPDHSVRGRPARHRDRDRDAGPLHLRYLTLPEREPRRRPGTLPGLRGSRPPRSPNTEATNSLFEPGVDPGPATVAKEITRILALPHGARPFRSVVDFTRFVIGEIIDATESHIREATTHMGPTNLLTVNQSRENA